MRRAWHQGEQETLAAIIEHRAAGLSWAKVADKLSATGHRTLVPAVSGRARAPPRSTKRANGSTAPQRKGRSGSGFGRFPHRDKP